MKKVLVQVKTILIAVIVIGMFGCALPLKETDLLEVKKITPGSVSDIIVNIEGGKNTEGKLLVFLHKEKETYYTDVNTNSDKFKSYRFQKVVPTPPRTTIIFSKIPQGKYSITAYHDENSDGKLNRHIFPFFGMPSEHYGISNNAYSYFSKASFEDSLILVNKPKIEVSIKLTHHLKKIF